LERPAGDERSPNDHAGGAVLLGSPIPVVLPFLKIGLDSF
jgi:hypothetical protein